MYISNSCFNRLNYFLANFLLDQLNFFCFTSQWGLEFLLGTEVSPSTSCAVCLCLHHSVNWFQSGFFPPVLGLDPVLFYCWAISQALYFILFFIFTEGITKLLRLPLDLWSSGLDSKKLGLQVWATIPASNFLWLIFKPLVPFVSKFGLCYLLPNDGAPCAVSSVWDCDGLKEH